MLDPALIVLRVISSLRGEGKPSWESCELSLFNQTDTSSQLKSNTNNPICSVQMCTTHRRVLSCHYCLPFKRFVALMRKTNMCTSCKWPGNVLFVFQHLPVPSLGFTTVDTKAWSSNRDQGSVERARQQSRGICRMTDMSVQFIEPNLTPQNQLCVSGKSFCAPFWDVFKEELLSMLGRVAIII